MMSHRSNYYNSEINSRSYGSRYMGNSDDNAQQYYNGPGGSNQALARNIQTASSKLGNANDNSTMEERKLFFRKLGLPRHEVFEYAMRSFESSAFDLDYFEYRMHKMQGQHLNEVEMKRRLLNEVYNTLQVPSNSQQSSINNGRSMSPVTLPPPLNIQGYLAKSNPIDYGRARSPTRNVSMGNRQFQSQFASSSRNNNLDRGLTKQNNWQTPHQQGGGDQSLLNWNQCQSSVPSQLNRGPELNKSNFGSSNSNNNMTSQNFNDFIQQRGPNFFDNSKYMSNLQPQAQNNFSRQSDNFNMNNRNNLNEQKNINNRNNIHEFNNTNNMIEMNNMKYRNEFNNQNNRNNMYEFLNMNNRNINNSNNLNNINTTNSENNMMGFSSPDQFNHINRGERQFNQSNIPNRGNIEPFFNSANLRFDNSGPYLDQSDSQFDTSILRFNDSFDRSSHVNNFGLRFNDSRDRSSRFDNSGTRFQDARDRNSRLESSRDRNSRRLSSSQRTISSNNNQMAPPRVQSKFLPQSKIQPAKTVPSVPLNPFVLQRSRALKQKLKKPAVQPATERGKRVRDTSESSTASQTPTTKRVKQDSTSEMKAVESPNKELIRQEEWQPLLDEFMRPEIFGDIGRPKPKGYMTREEFNKWWNDNKWIEDNLIVVGDNDSTIKNIFFSRREKNANHKKLLACEEKIEKSVNIVDDWRLYNNAYDFLKSKAIANEFLYVEKREYLGSSGQRCLNRIFTALRKANMIAFYKAIIQEYRKIYRKDFSQGYKPQLKELLRDKTFNWLVGLAFKEIKLFAEPVRKVKSNKLKSKLKELHTFAITKNKELYKSGNPHTTVKDDDKNEYIRNIIKKMEEFLNEQPELEYATCKTFMEYKLRLANKSLLKHLNKEVVEERLAFLTKLKADAYVQKIQLYMVRKLLSIHSRLQYLEAVHPRMIERENLQQMIAFQKFISEESLTLIAEHIFDEWLEVYKDFSHPNISVNMQRPVHKAKYLEKDGTAANKSDENDEDSNDEGNIDDPEDIEMQTVEQGENKIDENEEQENSQGDEENYKEDDDVVEIIDDSNAADQTGSANAQQPQKNEQNKNVTVQKQQRTTRGSAAGQM